MIVTPRHQPPVPVEDRPERPHRLSLTWLEGFLRCHRSALLSIRYGGGTGSHAMGRGSVVHEVIHRGTNAILEHGGRFFDETGTAQVDGQIPPDLAKALLAEVYADPRFTVPADDWDYMRQCAYHWAKYTILDPDEILGVEQLLVWDVGDWRISGKVDLAWMRGDKVGVIDYKTARRPLTVEEFKESFKTKAYALLLAYGKPVTVSEGPERIETVEPHSLGESSQFFEVTEVYPGVIWDRDEPTERMAHRERTLTRVDLVEERVMFESLLAQVSEVFETGQWDAVPGDDQCGKCPARGACPLPNAVLPLTGAISTPEEAEHYAMASFFLEAEKKAVDKALKAYVPEHGPIPLGDGYEYAVAPEKKTSVNREQLAADIAAGTAGPFDDYVKTSYSNRFGRRKAEVVETEPTLDEKYGAEAPF